MSDKHAIAFSYDEDSDIATIEGVRYHGDLLRFWGRGGAEVGELFMVEARERGTLTVTRFNQAAIISALEWASDAWAEYGGKEDIEDSTRLANIVKSIKNAGK